MLCDLDDETLICRRCNWEEKDKSTLRPIYRRCRVADPQPIIAKRRGLGDWLKLAIEYVFPWAKQRTGCGCRNRQAWLNHFGEQALKRLKPKRTEMWLAWAAEKWRWLRNK